MPALGFDLAVHPFDLLRGFACDCVAEHAARGRNVERLLVLDRRREVELPHQRQRIIRRQLERFGLLIVQRDLQRGPVEGGDLAAVLAPALDGELARLQAIGGDAAAAFHTALAADQQRGEPAGLADGGDLVLIAGVLEAVGRLANQEPLRAEEDLVVEIDPRRQLPGRRLGCGRCGGDRFRRRRRRRCFGRGGAFRPGGRFGHWRGFGHRRGGRFNLRRRGLGLCDRWRRRGGLRRHTFGFRLRRRCRCGGRRRRQFGDCDLERRLVRRRRQIGRDQRQRDVHRNRNEQRRDEHAPRAPPPHRGRQRAAGRGRWERAQQSGAGWRVHVLSVRFGDGRTVRRGQ